MNKRELAKELLKHKDIIKLLESSDYSPVVINRIIAEEILEEATSDAQSLKNKINTLIREKQFDKLASLLGILNDKNFTFQNLVDAGVYSKNEIKQIGPRIEGFKAALNNGGLSTQLERAQQTLEQAKSTEEQTKAAVEAEKVITAAETKAQKILRIHQSMIEKLAQKLDARKTVDIEDSVNKFKNLNIMQSPSFVFFLNQQIGKQVKESILFEDGSNEIMDLTSLKSAIQNNLGDIEFISNNTNIKIGELFKKKFGIDIGQGKNNSSKDTKELIEKLKGEYSQKNGSEEGFGKFIGAIVKDLKEKNAFTSENLKTAFDSALKNLKPGNKQSGSSQDSSGDLDSVIKEEDSKKFIEKLIDFCEKSKFTEDRELFNALEKFSTYADKIPDSKKEEAPVEKQADTGSESQSSDNPPAAKRDDEKQYLKEQEPNNSPVDVIIDKLKERKAIISVQQAKTLRAKLESIANKKPESPIVSFTEEEITKMVGLKNGIDIIKSIELKVKEALGGQLDGDLRSLAIAVLDKKPGAIRDFLSASIFKMDVADQKRIEEKLEQFYKPEEDISNHKMSKNLNDTQKRILSFVAKAFKNRKIAIKTEGGDQLAFSGDDLKKRYNKALGAVSFLDEEILPAIIISISKEADGNIMNEQELQEFFGSSKVTNETMSLINTVRRVLGNDNEDFIRNYTNFKSAFSSKEFRSFYGDLKKMINAFVNAELIKGDDGEIKEPEEFADTDSSEDQGEPIPAEAEIEDDSGSDEQSKGELDKLEKTKTNFKERVIQLIKDKKNKDLSGYSIFDYNSFVSGLMFYLKKQNKNVNEQEQNEDEVDKSKLTNGKQLEIILKDDDLRKQFYEIDAMFDGLLRNHFNSKYPFLGYILKKKYQQKIEVPSKKDAAKMDNPEDITSGDDSDWDNKEDVSNKDDEKKKDDDKKETPLSLKDAIKLINAKDFRLKSITKKAFINPDVQKAYIFLTAMIIGSVMKKQAQPEDSKAEGDELGPEVDLSEAENKQELFSILSGKIDNDLIAKWRDQFQKIGAMQNDEKGNVPEIVDYYKSMLKVVGGDSWKKPQIIDFINSVYGEARKYSEQGYHYVNSGNIIQIGKDMANKSNLYAESINEKKSSNQINLEESLKPIIERMLIEGGYKC